MRPYPSFPSLKPPSLLLPISSSFSLNQAAIVTSSYYLRSLSASSSRRLTTSDEVTPISAWSLSSAVGISRGGAGWSALAGRERWRVSVGGRGGNWRSIVLCKVLSCFLRAIWEVILGVDEYVTAVCRNGEEIVLFCSEVLVLNLLLKKLCGC